MRKIVLLSAFVSAMLVAMLPGSPAQAQNSRSWVSSTGSGKACSRAAPCYFFQDAHDATKDGGEINCVDSGFYYSGPAVTITKSITIDCGGVLGGVTTSGMVVNAPNAVVRLRNLSIDGAGAGIGDFGISFASGAALYVENCTITGWQTGTGRGISFAPTDGTASLYVTDSIISNNGLPKIGGGGIIIQPSGSAAARVMIDRSHVEGNTDGIAAVGTGGYVSTHIRDSVVANNALNGISAVGGGSTISVTVDRSSSLLNGADGILAKGASTFIVLANATVMSNVIGLQSLEGGNIVTYQNNQLTGNFTDGSPPNGKFSVK